MPGGESATLMIFSRRGPERQHVHVRYNHFTSPDSSRSDSFEGLDVEEGMLTLVKLWPQVRLRPDGIEVEARKCPRRGADLLELVTAAWREALGLPALSTEEFRRQVTARDSDRKALKEELIAELRGGPEGVAAWNARPGEERDQVGPLRRVEFSGAKLAGAELCHMDLTEAKLDEAHLVGADLSKGQLKGASFRGADLTDASCWRCKGTRAVFEGARLVRCNLRWAVLQRANLRDADLEAADLSSANLRGADLTGAILAGADLSGASYDEQTRWPSGFDPPAGMRWKGKGPAPATKPSKSSQAKVLRRSP
jgi:hypothetical protein